MVVLVETRTQESTEVVAMGEMAVMLEVVALAAVARGASISLVYGMAKMEVTAETVARWVTPDWEVSVGMAGHVAWMVRLGSLVQ
jgi:hypothetical protein